MLVVCLVGSRAVRELAAEVVACGAGGRQTAEIEQLEAENGELRRRLGQKSVELVDSVLG